MNKIFDTNFRFHAKQLTTEKFNSLFSEFFASIDKILIFGERLGTRL